MEWNSKHEDETGWLELLFEAPSNDPTNKAPHEDADDKPHPLLFSIVMERIFHSLLLDGSEVVPDGDKLKNIRNFRLVCRDWNEELTRILPDFYSCSSTHEIQELLVLMEHPHKPAPFLRNLTLNNYDGDLWKNPDTYKLLWNANDTLRVLQLRAVELEYWTFLLLPKMCPNIHTLELNCVDTYPEIKFGQLHFFEDIWMRPFCSLKVLKITKGSLSTSGALLIIGLLERVKSVDTLEIRTRDRHASRENTAALDILGREMIQTPELFGRLKSFELENKNCSAFINGMANIIKILKSPLHINLHTITFIQKCGSNFGIIPVKHMEVTISSLIHATSQTLKRLTIVNSSDTANMFSEATVGKVVLPQVMPKLNFACFGNVGLAVHCSGKREEVNFSALFPQLKHFEFWVRIFSDLSEPDKVALFNTLFPFDGEEEEQNSSGEQKNIKNFHLYTRLKLGHFNILQEIPLKFPSLRSIMLELDWGLLSLVVEGFKDLCIQHFTLVYYEGDLEMAEFDSSVTGIPIEKCKEILDEMLEKESPVLKDVDELKTMGGLPDWKCLERFNISYRHGGLLDSILLKYCIQLIPKLKHLELRHFDVKENILIRLIKRTDLETLTFGNSRILALDEDFPIFGYGSEYAIDDVIQKYGKKTKVSFVGHGPSDSESVPYYAYLLNHFDYDNQDWAEDF